METKTRPLTLLSKSQVASIRIGSARDSLFFPEGSKVPVGLREDKSLKLGEVDSLEIEVSLDGDTACDVGVVQIDYLVLEVLVRRGLVAILEDYWTWEQRASQPRSSVEISIDIASDGVKVLTLFDCRITIPRWPSEEESLMDMKIEAFPCEEFNNASFGIYPPYA